MTSDALYIYSKRYVVTPCIWNHLVYTWKKCRVQKSRMLLCVIVRYYNKEQEIRQTICYYGHTKSSHFHFQILDGGSKLPIFFNKNT